MLRLRPCPGCHRHVSVHESACVFCAAPLVRAVPAVEPLARLSRAAVFVAGVAGAGCWTSTPASTTPSAQATQGSQSATPAADAAVPVTAPDPDRRDIREGELDPDEQNHPCVSPGPGQPPVCAPYGAPPSRRRVV